MPKGKPTVGRRCTARSKRSRTQCGRQAILGGMVCPVHGGSAPQVRRKAEQRLADLIDPNRALREAARLAYSDVGELFDEHGYLLPLSKLPPHIRAAIGSIEVVKMNLTSGDGQQEYVHKIKLWNKPALIELLFKHLGLLKQRVEVSADQELLERLFAGRRRNAAVSNPAPE